MQPTIRYKALTRYNISVARLPSVGEEALETAAAAVCLRGHITKSELVFMWVFRSATGPTNREKIVCEVKELRRKATEADLPKQFADKIKAVVRGRA